MNGNISVSRKKIATKAQKSKVIQLRSIKKSEWDPKYLQNEKSPRNSFFFFEHGIVTNVALRCDKNWYRKMNRKCVFFFFLLSKLFSMIFFPFDWILMTFAIKNHSFIILRRGGRRACSVDLLSHSKLIIKHFFVFVETIWPSQRNILIWLKYLLHDRSKCSNFTLLVSKRRKNWLE